MGVFAGVTVKVTNTTIKSKKKYKPKIFINSYYPIETFETLINYKRTINLKLDTYVESTAIVSQNESPRKSTSIPMATAIV